MRLHSSFVMAIFAAVSVSGVAAQAFEGVVNQKMSAGGMNAEMVIYVKGDKYRQDMNAMGMGGGAMIVDGATGDMIMLMSEMKQYMKFPRQPAPDHAGKAPEFTSTGVKETIAGFNCEHYTVKTEDTEADICVATELGMFYGAGGGGGNPMGGRRGGGSDGLSSQAMKELAKQFKGGFFPLKIVSKSAGGTATIEVTKVEKKPVSDDMFAIPQGFTEMRMPGRGGF